MMDELLIGQEGRVRTLTLNRPEKRNALSAALRRRLGDEVTAAGTDPGTSVVIIRGAGSCFSAGNDMDAGIIEDPPLDQLNLRSLLGPVNQIMDCPIPVIAQVHGWCLAGATDIAFACDLVVASHTAAFGHPGVRVQGTPTTNMWLYHGGTQLAKWLLLTGENISGQDAARRGLVLASYEEEALTGEVELLATQMSRVNRDSLVANKLVLNHGLDLMGRSMLQAFATAQDTIAHTSAESREFRDHVRAHGTKSAIRARDEKFARGETR